MCVLVFVCMFACMFMSMFVCVFECMFVCVPDCPASDQSGTGMIKTNDARTDPVPDQADAVRHFFGPVPD